jgi:hypothetical protein
VAAFAQSEYRANKAEARELARRGMRGFGDRPDRDRQRETAPRTNSILQFSEKSLAERVSQQKPDTDAGILEIGEPEISANKWREYRKRQAIDVTDQCCQK